MVDNWVIAKHQATLAELVRKFETWFFPDQDFYEAYEREILMYANEMAQKQREYTNTKIDYVKLYVQKCNEYKTEKEKVSVAEAERQTDLYFVETKAWVDRFEATTKMYMDVLNNYRRFGEIIKSRLIKDMSDQKRLDTVQKAQSLWTIADETPF